MQCLLIYDTELNTGKDYLRTTIKRGPGLNVILNKSQFASIHFLLCGNHPIKDFRSRF